MSIQSFTIGPVHSVIAVNPLDLVPIAYAMPARKVTVFYENVGQMEVSNTSDFGTSLVIPTTVPPGLPFDNSAPFIRFTTDGTIRLVAV